MNSASTKASRPGRPVNSHVNVALRERIASMSDIVDYFSANGQRVPPWMLEMFAAWMTEAVHKQSENVVN